MTTDADGKRLMATVLVVDDHPANRDLVVTLLGYRHHTTIEAANGAEALVAARDVHPDLVITDLLMPVMDGYELVRELRADPALASTKVIFHTANYLYDEVRPVAEAAGVRYIVPKPSDSAQFLSVVDEALACDGQQAATLPPDAFNREHLRTLSAKLVNKVNELEAAETALKQSEALFRTLTESSPVGIFSLGRDGRLVYTNQRLRQICGLPEDTSSDSAWTDLVHPDDRELLVGLRTSAVVNRQPYRDRMRVVRPDGDLRWVDVTAAPVEGDRGELSHVGTVEDVTEVVEARRKHDDLERRLRTSERLESLGQLSAGIAHDFNNLLGAMGSYAQFVASAIEKLASSGETPQLAQMREDIAGVLGAADRAAELTRQLLIFGRQEIIRPEVVDANNLVREAQQLLKRTIGEHINLESRLAPDLWPVRVDRSRFEQVVINLVVNARDAIAGTGTVRMTTDNVELDEETARSHGAASPGRFVRLRVTDNGEGMTQETIARAFEPFFTTKPKSHGTGLGLATVHGIIHQLGGFVSVYSEPGRGTTMRVYLPAANATASGRTDRSVGDVRGCGQVVLVVEDDDDIRAATVRILAENGYAVVAVDRAPHAVSILEDPKVAVDLLLTDVVMQELSGRDLAEHAARARPDLPVLFMSGYAQGLAGPNSALPPGVKLLEKPFTHHSLLRVVAQSLLVTPEVDGR